MIGLYVHVPFCTLRCSYCDFYLVAGRGRDLEGFAAALCAEIEAVPEPLPGRAADTVHFGGGTPSLLPPALLGRILRALRRTFALADGAEIALEANPEDLDDRRLQALADLGVTRIAIGVQALDDPTLSLMRRPHTAARAIEAVRAARRSAIGSVGADLILGLPGQEGAAALGALERLAGLGVDHLSLYLLEVHERTRLGREARLGRLHPMGEDACAALYEEAADRMAALGFEHYEISNFARPGHRSRHNLKYWTDQEYLGFGPSAHSYVLGRRLRNAADLRAYLAGDPAARRIDDREARPVRAFEAILSGLRIAEGIDLAALRERYGSALPDLEGPAVEGLREAGLVERGAGRLRLTRRGRLLSNEVCERLLPGPRRAPVPLA